MEASPSYLEDDGDGGVKPFIVKFHSTVSHRSESSFLECVPHCTRMRGHRCFYFVFSVGAGACTAHTVRGGGTGHAGTVAGGGFWAVSGVL